MSASIELHELDRLNRTRRRSIEQWEQVFHELDVNGDGTIDIEEFKSMIKSNPDYRHLPNKTINAIFRKADRDGNQKVSLDEFLAIVKHPEYESKFTYLRKRFREAGTNYVKFIIPPCHFPDAIDGEVEDNTNCRPPPIAMITMSLVIVILFMIDAIKEDNMYATGSVATKLLYDPQRRKEAWRYVSYMFVHVGKGHLIVNIVVQLLLGIPLEMCHKGHRISVIYLAGVLAGSLGTSICDPTVKLAGASGGVYCLLTAYLADVIINWKEMNNGRPLLQVASISLLIVCDVGSSVYQRYVLQKFEKIGYAAHFFGALAGLLVGLKILRNFQVSRWEKVLETVAILLYLILIGFAIYWNIAMTDYFPKQKV